MNDSIIESLDRLTNMSDADIAEIDAKIKDLESQISRLRRVRLLASGVTRGLKTSNGKPVLRWQPTPERLLVEAKKVAAIIVANGDEIRKGHVTALAKKSGIYQVLTDIILKTPWFEKNGSKPKSPWRLTELGKKELLENADGRQA